MTIGHYRALFRHNAWANRRILEEARTLPDSRLLAPVGLDIQDGSILATLHHLFDTEDSWLVRCQGREPDRYLANAPLGAPDTGNLSFESVAAQCRANDIAWDRYLGHLTDRDLDEIVTNTSGAGRTFGSPRWARLSHALSHSTQHRGELALVLTQAGTSPGELDFLYYFMRFDPDR